MQKGLMRTLPGSSIANHGSQSTVASSTKIYFNNDILGVEDANHQGEDDYHNLKHAGL